MSRERVGYIGLGLMGRPAAHNLLKAGFDVSVYARRPEATWPLVESGAKSYDSPSELAAATDVIFINVSDTPDVESVILGVEGIIEGARPGSVVVDMSTISPAVTRRLAETLAEEGIEMLDAPVSGGTKGAIDGTLTFMVGGKADVYERVKPLFEAMGTTINHMGDHGAGQVAKACNQLLVAQTIAAVGEAFLLASANGVDPAKVREALLGGFAGSRILEMHGRRILEDDYEPGFKAALHQKDMRIVQETAAECGLALPGTALAGQYINDMVRQGMGELDSSALVKVLEKMSSVSIKRNKSDL